MVEMDAVTRERYEAWMRRKILKRLVLPSVLILILLIGLILGLRSCGRESEETPELEPPYSDEIEDNDVDDPESTPTAHTQLTYQDFNFSIYDEAVMVEIEAVDLNDYLVLVNKVFRVPEDFVPEDLVIPEVSALWGYPNTIHQMRKTASAALEALFGAAYEEEGLVLWALSGYRSFEEEANRHQYMIDRDGLEIAETLSTRPGHSEHQTGLAMSVTASSAGGVSTQAFASAPEGLWLAENAHRFGFILRYPDGNINLTGFAHKPWHLRYVGIEVATHLFENEMVLEQYLLPVPRWEQP